MRGRSQRQKSKTVKVTPKSHSCAPFICGDVYRVTEESEIEKVLPPENNNVLIS